MPKRQKKIMTPSLHVPPIMVKVVVPATTTEGGSDGGAFGDVVINLESRGSRYKLAEQLRELANHVANTVGDPIEGARIVLLLRRASRRDEKSQ